jgi:uncharacterized protein (TIGR02271 family)
MILSFKHGLFTRERHVIVPIGRARLDDAHDRVILENITAKDAGNLPDYDPAKLTPEFERQAFGEGTGTEGFYNRPDYDSNRLFGSRAKNPEEAYLRLNEEKLEVGKREVEAGAVGVKKRVETERVSETVPVAHEEVKVERRPLPPEAAPSGVSVSEQEIRVPVMKEEATVGKRVVANEEVIIRKERVEGEQKVEADLKREVADVDTSGVTTAEKERAAATPGTVADRKKEEV